MKATLKLIAVYLVFVLLLFLAVILTSCGSNWHLRRTEHHLKKAELKGHTTPTHFVNLPMRNAIIPGYNGMYTINEDGVITNTKRNRVVTPNLCRGYHRVKLFLNNSRSYHFVHRLVAECFIPNPDGKPFINHIDSDKLNNTINNLEWCTPKENTNHARNKGRWPSMKGRRSELRGERTYNAIFEKAHIPIILEAIDSGFSLSAIGKYFNASKGTIWKIKAGYSWRP